MAIELPHIIIVAGPTAVGKTSYAIDLAKKVNGEVVSADSMQIYKDLEIGTAKPTLEERAKVKHHMIDFLDPSASYSVYEYRRDAGNVISDILSRGKVPVVCGGTGLYIHSLLYDMDFQNAEGRTKSRSEYSNMSSEELSRILTKKGVELSSDDAGNVRRMARMLEVIEETGSLKSFDKSERKSSQYDTRLIVLDRDREILYDRINRRVDMMLDSGLVEEVKDILASGLDRNVQSMQAIGYKEVLLYLDGKVDFDEMAELIKRNSRRYAKRQLTWFRRYTHQIKISL